MASEIRTRILNRAQALYGDLALDSGFALTYLISLTVLFLQDQYLQSDPFGVSLLAVTMAAVPLLVGLLWKSFSVRSNQTRQLKINLAALVTVWVLQVAVLISFQVFVLEIPTMPIEWTWFVFGAYLFFLCTVYSLVSHLSSRYKRVQIEAAQAEAQIASLKTESDDMVRRAERRMRADAGQAFKRHFDTILGLVSLKAEPADVRRLIDELRDLTLRPLSRTLATQLIDLEPLVGAAQVTSPYALPNKFVIKNAVRPALYAAVIPLYIAGQLGINGPATLASTAVFSVTLIMLWCLVKLVAPRVSTRASFGIFVLVGLSIIIPWVATYVERLIVIPADPSVPFVEEALNNLQLHPVMILGAAYIQNVSGHLAELESQMSNLRTELGYRKQLVAQRIMVVQKRFAYFLHGAVQSRLNAAVMRLQADPLAPGAWQSFTHEIYATEASVQDEVSSVIQLKQAIAELRSVWAGVVEVSFDIPDEAIERLDRDQVVAFALNEIWREAASNAVRHGGAKRINISVEFSENVVETTVSNDGAEIVNVPQASLGLALLDDLTAEWWFEESAGAEWPVRLHAKLLLS